MSIWTDGQRLGWEGRGEGAYPLRLWLITNLKTPWRSGTRNVTAYLPGSLEGESAVRMCGSSIVNSSWRSLTPEYGSQRSSSGLYLEMYAS